MKAQKVMEIVDSTAIVRLLNVALIHLDLVKYSW
jgi:hypothetical protein